MIPMRPSGHVGAATAEGLRRRLHNPQPQIEDLYRRLSESPHDIPEPPPVATGGVETIFVYRDTPSNTQAIPNNSLTAVTFGTGTSVFETAGASAFGAYVQQHASWLEDGVELSADCVVEVAVSAQFAANATGIREVFAVRSGAIQHGNRSPGHGSRVAYLSASEPVIAYSGEFLSLYAFQDSGGNLNLSHPHLVVSFYTQETL